MIKNFLALLILLFSFNLLAQDEQENTMSVNELINRISNDSLFVVLDVRTPEELEGDLGKINDVINIPVQELEARLSELEPYRKYEFAVICKMGIRSKYATDILLRNGYSAKNVLGGMLEYRKNVETNDP